MTEPTADPQHAAEGTAPPAAEQRTCPTCHSAMAPEQDWCLSCGQATPGLLGVRPGGRAVAAVASLTLLLCGGAVAASYAALNKDEPAPASTALVAQVPAATTAAAAAPAPVAPATTTQPATATTSTQPGATSGQPPATPAGSAAAPSAVVPSSPATTATTTTKSDATPRTDTGDTSTTTTPDTTKAPDPVPIALKGAALSLYDPYTRVVTPGTPARALPAIDASKQDTKFWKSVVKTVKGDVGVGLLIDLGTARGVRVAQFTTTTPGFRTEVYATDSDELPPNVLDTRWAHLKDQDDVGVKDDAKDDSKGDGSARIVLGRGSTPYRYLLLWITDPPTADATLVDPATPPQTVTNADATVTTLTAATISIAALQLLG